VLPGLGGQFVQPGLPTQHFEQPGVATGMEPGVATGMDSGPQSWPNLVGKDTALARSVIQQDAPGKQVFLVPSGNLVTMDYRTDRVRIFYDPSTNLVTEAPMVG
jgi:hypothetical protein